MPNVQDLVKLLNDVVESFKKKIPTLQSTATNNIIRAVSELRLDASGSLVNSVENLRTVNKIRSQILQLLVTDDWKSAVQKHAQAYDTVSDLQHELFKQLDANYTPPEILNEIKLQTKKDVIRSLADSGVAVNIGDKLMQVITSNVVSGGSYNQLAEQLKRLTQGSPTLFTNADESIISRYAKQIVTDSINQYSRVNIQVASADLGYEWFEYQGNDIETTRPFCDAMTDQPYFHVSEIPRLLKAKDLFYTNNKTGQREAVPLYAKTGLPHGMYEDTNVANFQQKAGGYNCGHQIFPVKERFVPPEVVQRVKSTPAYELYKGIQPEDDLVKIKNLRKKGETFLDNLGKDAAKKFNGTVTPVNFKSDESTLRKANADYGGEIGRVKDSLRSTVIVAYNKIEETLAWLAEQPNVSGKAKAQRHNTDPLGYEGNILNYYTNDGLLIEMQVNYSDMIYAKEPAELVIPIIGQKEYDRLQKKYDGIGGKGHLFYEEWRKIQYSETPSDIARRIEIEQQSKDYYAQFVGGGKPEPVPVYDVHELLLQTPRLENETDKAYAKRVIDKLPSPPAEIVPQGHENYFAFDETSPIIDIGKLNPVRVDVQSSENAVNRLWAAKEGLLAKRAPIMVMKMKDGTYTVLDGNSTVVAAKNLGWTDVPVNVVVGDELARGLGFADAHQLLYYATTLTGKKYSFLREVPDADLLSLFELSKKIDFVDNSKINEGELWNLINQNYDNLSWEFKDAIQSWTGSSDNIRTMSDKNPVKQLFLKAAKEVATNVTEIWRGEKYAVYHEFGEFMKEYYLKNFVEGAIVDLSERIRLVTKDGSNFEFDRRLMSFSKEQQAAEKFTGISDGYLLNVLIKIVNKSGVRGLDISGISSYDREREVIAGDDHKYKVIKREYDESRTKLILTLEQMI